VSTTAAILGAALATMLYAQHSSQNATGSSFPRRSPLYECIAGSLVGYSVWIRQVSLVYAPIFLMCFLLYPIITGFSSRRFVRGTSSAIVFGICFLVFQTGLMVYNLQTFGSPTHTGYTYWAPDFFMDLRQSFSLDNVQPHIGIYLKALLGRAELDPLTGQPLTLYPAPVALLAALAILIAVVSATQRAWKHSSRLALGLSSRWMSASAPQTCFGLLSGVLIITTYVVHVLYVFYDLRFMHLTIPLVAILASGGAVAVVGWSRRVLAQHLAFSRMPANIFGLMTIVVVGWQLSGPAIRNLESSWRAPAEDSYTATAYEGMQLVSRYTEPDALVITDLNPLVFGAYQWRNERRQIVLDMQALLQRQPIPASANLVDFRANSALAVQLVSERKHLYFLGKPTDYFSVESPSETTLEPVARIPGPSAVRDAGLYRVSLRSQSGISPVPKGFSKMPPTR
jgi:hypothetical protein